MSFLWLIKRSAVYASYSSAARPPSRSSLGKGRKKCSESAHPNAGGPAGIPHHLGDERSPTTAAHLCSAVLCCALSRFAARRRRRHGSPKVSDTRAKHAAMHASIILILTHIAVSSLVYKWLSERYPLINQIANADIKPEFGQGTQHRQKGNTGRGRGKQAHSTTRPARGGWRSSWLGCLCSNLTLSCSSLLWLQTICIWI